MANTTKTAIVTGASRGIGAGLVEAFLKRGYNVVELVYGNYSDKKRDDLYQQLLSNLGKE